MVVNNYPKYEILENGVIIGARGNPLKFDKNSTGYLRVTLCKDGIPNRVFVHKLMAEHFVEGYEEGLVINHKDGNNQNNHKDNLEWVTPSYNVKDGGDVEETLPIFILISERVRCKVQRLVERRRAKRLETGETVYR